MTEHIDADVVIGEEEGHGHVACGTPKEEAGEPAEGKRWVAIQKGEETTVAVVDEDEFKRMVGCDE